MALWLIIHNNGNKSQHGNLD